MTKDEILSFVKDKNIVEVRYDPNYPCITFVFEDKSEIEVWTEECFEFHIDMEA